VQPDEERLLSYAMTWARRCSSPSRHPQSQDDVQIGSDQLTAKYSNQRTTKYLVKNDSSTTGLVILEHPIEATGSWRIQPAGQQDPEPLRFEVEVAKANRQRSRWSRIKPHRSDFTCQDGQGHADVYRHHGYRDQTRRENSPAEVTKVSISQGPAVVEEKIAETRAYYVQNTSEEDRTFGHRLCDPAAWEVLLGKGKDDVGPGIHRFELAVKAGKDRDAQEIDEESIGLSKASKLVKDESPAMLKTISTIRSWPRMSSNPGKSSEAPGREKGTGNQAHQAQERPERGDRDQGRLRDNLKIVRKTPMCTRNSGQVRQAGNADRQLQDQVREIREPAWTRKPRNTRITSRI